MSKTFYIVWIGGIEDYEGYSLRKAKAIFNEWIALGYDDVVIQTIIGG